MSSLLKNPKFRYIITPAIGFGLGGAIWGGVLYKWSLGVSSPNPFSYIYGAISLGLFGSISLTLFSQSIRSILRTSIFGILGSLIGFVFVGSMSYYLFLLGRTFAPWRILLGDERWDKISQLRPSLTLGDFWIAFLVAGFIIGIFYSFALGKRKFLVGLYGSTGLALGALIAPIAGNTFGILASSLLASYIFTFLLIGLLLGVFLGVAMTKQ